MAPNNIVRVPRGAVQSAAPQQGNWVYNPQTGTWDCGCDGNGSSSPCPPPGWPPAGCPPWYSGMNSPPWYPGANAGVSFGTTAPPNPVRGHFWWDGTTLWLFDGAAWVGVGSEGAGGGSGGGGAYVGTTPPAAPFAGQGWWNGTVLQIYDGSAWHTVGPGAAPGPFPTTTICLGVALPPPAGVTIPATTWSIVPFGGITPLVDTMGGFDPVSFKYKPTKAGVYQFGCRIYAGGTGAFGVAVIKNDSGSFTSSADNVTALQVISGTSVSEWMSAQGVAQMNGTTDFVRMFAYSSSGTIYGSGGNPVFSAVAFP